MSNTITVSMQDLDDNWISDHAIQTLHAYTGQSFTSTRRLELSTILAALGIDDTLEILDAATLNTRRQRVLLAVAMARHALPALEDTTTYHRYHLALYTALKYARSEMSDLEYDRKANDFMTEVMVAKKSETGELPTPVVYAREAIEQAVLGMTAEVDDAMFGTIDGPVERRRYGCWGMTADVDDAMFGTVDDPDVLTGRHHRYLVCLIEQGTAALEQMIDAGDPGTRTLLQNK